MSDSYYYKIIYREGTTQKTTLISASYSIKRIKKILAEVHPSWDIIRVQATGKKVERVE
tara:strand:- start:131 stop:307 length:177 start_codon:yes stop_codon:yes gene_type:complete